MMNIKELLYEICEDERVFDDETDLVESGLLDSYSVIELLSRLEDEGFDIQITRIDRNLLHSAKGIEKLIGELMTEK
ncbi:MAG: hypothetical protein IKL57_06295 [Oscillospiraceae bacterium]|nr:hypothetical protein [Oscillospiraceae bacterium]